MWVPWEHLITPLPLTSNTSSKRHFSDLFSLISTAHHITFIFNSNSKNRSRMQEQRLTWVKRCRAGHGRATWQIVLRTAKVPLFWLVITAGLSHWIHAVVMAGGDGKGDFQQTRKHFHHTVLVSLVYWIFLPRLPIYPVWLLKCLYFCSSFSITETVMRLHIFYQSLNFLKYSISHLWGRKGHSTFLCSI